MKKISEKIMYNGVRFNVLQRKYKDNDKEYIRDIVDTKDAAIILPIDNSGNIIFLKQLREVVEEVMLELPAGIIEEGEEKEKAALRELEEETGLKAQTIEHLISVYPSCGYTNEKIHIYLAKNFEKGKVNLDEDEHIQEVIKIKIEDAFYMLEKGDFKEANVILALLMYKEKYMK